MSDINNILFVCTGNSCRSVMAEAYFKKRSQEEKLSLEVQSAGTMGLVGMSPTHETTEVLADENISAAGCRSQALTKDLTDWADVILVMTSSHKEEILGVDPQAEEKIHYLGNFNKKNEEDKDIFIPDPIGASYDTYKKSFELIKATVEELIKWLKR